MEAVPVFRTSKRRKVARPHEESPSDSHVLVPINSTENKAQVGDDEDEITAEADASVSNLIRARKHARRPAIGVQFSTTRMGRPPVSEASTVLASTGETTDRPVDIANRFVGSTGQVVNVDKHMVAFIESELARKRNTPISGFHDAQRHQIDSDSEAPGVVKPSDLKLSTPNPAAARQLAEVDLGTTAQERNLARTQAALERAKAGQAPIDEEVKPPKPRKPRLGRDGKPFRPRPKKRRNSEDVARDALVEQFLHENKVDMYDTNGPNTANGKRLDGQAAGDADADEHFAEQFQKEFMDAMAERKSNKAKPPVQTKGVAVPEPRGPKLGGSRSARAKMAQIQQQALAQAKK